MEGLAALLPAFDAGRALSADALFAASELAMVVPAAVLVTLPFWDRLRWGRVRYAALASAFSAVLVASAPVVAGLGLPTNDVLLPGLAVLFAAYVRAVDASLAKKAGIFLSVAMLSAFVTYTAIIADAFLGGDSGSSYLNLPGVVTQWALWAAAGALLARPMRTRLPAILDGPAAGKRFWALFWILPLFMTCGLLLLVPEDTSTLLYRRVGLAAVVGVGTLAVLTCLSYALFIRLASQANAVLAAQQGENDLRLRLLMQGHLEDRMDDARRARHDLRQHDRAVRGFIETGDTEGLVAYLDEREERAAGLAPLRVCENPALNAVAVFYWDAALRAGASVDMHIDLPRHPGVPQDELVVVLGNLLENAVEAFEQEGSGGELHVLARGDAQGAVFVRVANTCSKEPDIASEGIVSTKHAGVGLGTRSVRAIAAAHGGVATFTCSDGLFVADVMLGA